MFLITEIVIRNMAPGSGEETAAGGVVMVLHDGGRPFGVDAGEFEEVLGGQAFGDGVFAIGDFAEGEEGELGEILGADAELEGDEGVPEFEFFFAFIGGKEFAELVAGDFKVAEVVVEVFAFDEVGEDVGDGPLEERVR